VCGITQKLDALRATFLFAGRVFGHRVAAIAEAVELIEVLGTGTIRGNEFILVQIFSPRVGTAPSIGPVK
jgi:hypothetical protein